MPRLQPQNPAKPQATSTSNTHIRRTPRSRRPCTCLKVQHHHETPGRWRNNGREGEGKGRSTCGGADAAERDDPLAGDPEVVMREQAAPFPAEALHVRKNNKHPSASATIPPHGDSRGVRRRSPWRRARCRGASLRALLPRPAVAAPG